MLQSRTNIITMVMALVTLLIGGFLLVSQLRSPSEFTFARANGVGGVVPLQVPADIQARSARGADGSLSMLSLSASADRWLELAADADCLAQEPSQLKGFFGPRTSISISLRMADAAFIKRMYDGSLKIGTRQFESDIRSIPSSGVTSPRRYLLSLPNRNDALQYADCPYFGTGCRITTLVAPELVGDITVSSRAFDRWAHQVDVVSCVAESFRVTPGAEPGM